MPAWDDGAPPQEGGFGSSRGVCVCGGGGASGGFRVLRARGVSLCRKLHNARF